MRKYKLIIDHDSCWGCKTCEVACKQENPTQDSVKLIAVSEDFTKRINGKPDFVFHVNVCQHCDGPPCVEICPEDAIEKRTDGIVIMDYEKCSGCGACIEVCSYNVIDFDDENNIAQKCNLCHHRIDLGLVPACSDNICLAHCFQFGCADQNRIVCK
ncbi:4Fe-4S dicluster domain-containing protein [Desulfococcaceae bacterium HSG9]|nr:4Fe-4S dicluster domain-containing protein [Desulfococcaceae bacterium HSG9]